MKQIVILVSIDMESFGKPLKLYLKHERTVTANHRHVLTKGSIMLYFPEGFAQRFFIMF